MIFLSLFLGILIVFLLFQVAYSAYYLSVSKKMIAAKDTRRNAELGDATRPHINLFISGDSVAAEVGASDFAHSVAGRIGLYLAKKHAVRFHNEAISGVRMHELLTMPLPETKQDIMVLIVSSNDLFTGIPLTAFKTATASVLALYAPLARKVILVGPGRVFDGEAVPYPLRLFYKVQSPRYVRAIKSVLKEYPHVIYINPTDATFYEGSYGPTTAADKFHPNDEGHRLWFDMIRPFI